MRRICYATFRALMIAAAAANCIGLAVADEPTATPTDPAPEATATDQFQVEALEVQRALGGPIVDQFPWLQRQTEGTPWWKRFRGSLESSPGSAQIQRTPSTGPAPNAWPGWWVPAAAPTVVPATAELPAPSQPLPQVTALRKTAAELEETANRLEEIELYDESDAIRELAQRLRRNARERLARERGTDSRTPPVDAPALWSPPGQQGQDFGPRSIPSDPPRTQSLLERRWRNEEAVTGDPPVDLVEGTSLGEERSVLVGPAPE